MPGPSALTARGGRVRGVTAAARSLGGYGWAVVGLLTAFAVLLLWNVAHFPPARGFDSSEHFGYVEVLRTQHRLPTPQDISASWQEPPFFHMIGALVESVFMAVQGHLGDRVAALDPHRLVQLLNVVFAVGIVALVFLTARELFPRSRIAPIAALLFTALAPPLVRGAVIYHGAVTAALLTTAAMYFAVRFLVRGGPWLPLALLLGALLGLSVVTRQFSLGIVGGVVAALILARLLARHPTALRVAAVTVGVTAVVTAPWFIHQQVRYGSPLALSREPPATPFFERAPDGFYLGGSIADVFETPYRPALEGHMPQMLYADWWGDYHEYFDVPSALVGSPDLPDRVRDALRRQVVVGLLPTAIMLIGVAGMAIAGLRRRSAALLLGPLCFAAVATEALYTYQAWAGDSDFIKAIYVLMALPALALGGAWAIDRLAIRSRPTFLVVSALLAVAGAVNVTFLWLDGSVT